MLAIYIGLQLLVVLLGIKVLRIQWFLLHINPGNNSIYLDVDHDCLVQYTHEYYDNVYWYPNARKIVLRVFGHDIGDIIMDYCRNMKLGSDSDSTDTLIHDIWKPHWR